MRAMTILAALLLAMAGGAYGALVASGGGSAVGEPNVVVPVKPPPLKAPTVAVKPPMVNTQPDASGAAPGANLASAPTATTPVLPSQQSGPAAEPPAQAPATQRATPAKPAGFTVPGLSIDAATAAPSPPARAPLPRNLPTSAPAGLGGKTPGG